MRIAGWDELVKILKGMVEVFYGFDPNSTATIDLRLRRTAYTFGNSCRHF